MQNSSSPNVPALAFNGVEIHDRNEMLCLTDMWKAGGADAQQAPAKWRALPSAKAFIDHVEVTIGKSDSDLFVVKNGGKTPGTWAHWQIGLAYAKYLSPEFHMWCNTVVRERMEGKTATTALSAEALDEITRTFGIVRSTIHKVTEMEKAMNTLPALVETVNALVALVQPATPGTIIRHGKTAGSILKAAGFTNCPQCLAVWFGNRLEAAGCRVEGRIDTGTSRSRLFDPDRAEAWLANGGRKSVEMKLLERKGQGALALTGRSPRPMVAAQADLMPMMPPDMREEGLGLVILNGEPVFFDIRAKVAEGDRAVIVTNAGDVLVDVPQQMRDSYRPMGPRGAMASPKMEAVPGRSKPMMVGWMCMILGKVIDRANVISLLPRENVAH